MLTIKTLKEHLTPTILKEWFFLATLCFVPMELAVHLHWGSVLSPYKITMLILLGLIFLEWIRDPKGVTISYLKSIATGFSNIKAIGLFLGLFFAYDFLSLLWTADVKFALSKYITILPMFVLFLYGCHYLFEGQPTKELLQRRTLNVALAMAAMAFVLCLSTWILYALNQRTAYILRLSLQMDYNQYATSIFLGYICGVYAILQWRNTKFQWLVLFGYSLLCLPVLYLSGSRRAMVLYPVIVGLYLLYYFVFRTLPAYFSKKSQRKIITTRMVITFIVILLATQGVIRWYQSHADTVYEAMAKDAALAKPTETAAGPTKKPAFRPEKNLAFKADTISTGDAMGARDAIWSIATDTISSFSPLELLIGKGGSAQRDIYRTESAISILYPRGVPETARSPPSLDDLCRYDQRWSGKISDHLGSCRRHRLLRFAAVDPSPLAGSDLFPFLCRSVFVWTNHR